MKKSQHLRPDWLTTSALVVILTGLLIGFATVAVAASPATSPSPSSATAGTTGAGAGGALPGDPTKGQALYNSSGCSACHGASLEGGIGARLKPLENLGNAPNPADPAYLIATITNGLQGAGKYSAAMPAKGGKDLSDQDIKDLVAFIIKSQMDKGPAALSAGELAKSNVTWVTIGVLVMVGLTWLLAQYNMRWIARKAAARRTDGRV